MKITLVKRVFKDTSMGYLEPVGKFIKSLKSSFIQPIPNTSIILKDENFYIKAVVQDTTTNTMILFEDNEFAYYDIKEKLPKLKRKLKAKGWIWNDDNS